MRAPEEITRRYSGQFLSISTPFPYRVPSTNVCLGESDASIAGTYSGGCYEVLRGLARWPSRSYWHTHLEVGIHAQHVVTKSLLEATNNRTAQPAVHRSDDDTDVVALLLQQRHSLYRPVARVIVHDDNLDLVWWNRRVGPAKCTEYARNEGLQVAILLVRWYNHGVLNGLVLLLVGHLGVRL